MKTASVMQPVSLSFAQRIAARYDARRLLAFGASPLVSANGIARSLSRWIDLVYATPYVERMTVVREKEQTNVPALARSIVQTWDLIVQLEDVHLHNHSQTLSLAYRERQAMQVQQTRLDDASPAQAPGAPGSAAKEQAAKALNNPTRPAAQHQGDIDGASDHRSTQTYRIQEPGSAPGRARHVPAMDVPSLGRAQRQDPAPMRERSSGPVPKMHQDKTHGRHKVPRVPDTEAGKNAGAWGSKNSAAEFKVDQSTPSQPPAILAHKPFAVGETAAGAPGAIAWRINGQKSLGDAPGRTGDRQPGWPILDLLDASREQAPHAQQADGEWLEQSTTTAYDSGTRARFVSPGDAARQAQHAEARTSTGPDNPAKPSNADLERIADQVYRMLERKIRIERERRGL